MPLQPDHDVRAHGAAPAPPAASRSAPAAGKRTRSELAAGAHDADDTHDTSDALPAGVDYRAVPGTLRLVVRKAWLLSALTAPVGRSVVTPPRLHELLVHLRDTGVLAWADDAALTRAAEHVAIASLPRGAFVELELPSELFRYLGLPPSAGSLVDRAGDGLLVVLPLTLSAPGTAPGEGQRAPLPPRQRRQLLTAVEEFLGVPAMKPARDQFVRTADVACVVHGATASLRLSRQDLIWLFGEAMVEELLDNGAATGPRLLAAKPPASSGSRTNPPASSGSRTDTAQPPTTSATGEPAAPATTATSSPPSTASSTASPTTSTPAGLTPDEESTALRWIAQHAGPDAATPANVSRYLAEQIRAIEAHPQRALILESLRQALANHAAPSRISGRELELLISWAEHEAARREAGLRDRAYSSPLDEVSASFSGPVFDFPVPATLHHTASTAFSDLPVAVAGEELTFSIAVSWPHAVTGAQHHEAVLRDRAVECEWVFQRASNAGPDARAAARTRDLTPTRRQRFQLDPANKAPTETWTLHVFLTHNFFRPARLALTFEVRSERAFLDETAATTFAPLGGAGAARPKAFGERNHDDGLQFGGELPASFHRASFAERRAHLQQEISQLTQVRAYLEKSGETEALAACDRTIAKLRQTLHDLTDESLEGWKPFSARAVFIGKGDHRLDGPLELDASAQLDHRSYAGLNCVRVRLRDLSRRLSSEVTCFESAGETFEHALERAFYDLCKHYPRGTLSLLAERIPLGPYVRVAPEVPSGRTTIGFSLDTQSSWEDIKEAVFDPAVNLAVNAAATVVMVFAPATIPVVMPLTIAYNSAQTIDGLAEAWTSGTLTPSQGALGLAELGLNVLPLAGRLPLLSSSKLAFSMVHLADLSGQVLLLTSQAQLQIAELRDRDLSQIAALYAQLIALERSGQPDPAKLAAQRAAVDVLAIQLRQRTLEVWSELVTQQAIAMAPARIANHLTGHLHQSRSAANTTGEPLGSSGSLLDPTPSEAGGPGFPQSRRVLLLGDDERAKVASHQLRPVDGYLDVFVHGEADRMEIKFRDSDATLTPRQLAAYLRKLGLEGTPIRLISCDTGAHPGAVAQHLSNALGVEVLAPTMKAWNDADGNLRVGKHAGDDSGELLSFGPRPAEPKKQPSPLQREREGRDFRDESAPAELTRALHRDERSRLAAASEAQLVSLRKALGAPLIMDDSLGDGVRVEVRRVPRAAGADLVVESVRAGKQTLTADILAHRRVILEVERYNGALGKLRYLADAFKRWASGRRPAFPHGSRGWVTELELGKLDELLAARATPLHGGAVDELALLDERKFLEGRRLFHEEVLRSVGETGGDPAHLFTFERPDTGEVTRQALAAGYRLPGAAEGVQPDWYYYRNSVELPGQYELVRKPSAPLEAPALRVRLVGDEHTGFLPIETRPAVKLPHDMAMPDIVKHLRATAGFGDYADMLQAHGLASQTVVDAAIQSAVNRRRMQGKGPVTTEAIRHDVKSAFRQRVLDYVCDPSLDEHASMQRLRATIEKLHSADRGAIAETWYLSRHAPRADRHVPVGIARRSGRNAGKLERRTLDAVQGKTAIEIKDVTGSIDRDQFNAYVDLIIGEKSLAQSSNRELTKLRYVFTNPEGALENLRFLGDSLRLQALNGRLTVEVFDRRGKRHIITNYAEATNMRKLLEADQQ